MQRLVNVNGFTSFSLGDFLEVLVKTSEPFSLLLTSSISNSANSFSRSVRDVRRPVPAVAAVDVILDAFDVTEASRLTGETRVDLFMGGYELFFGECERDRSEPGEGLRLFDTDEFIVG